VNRSKQLKAETLNNLPAAAVQLLKDAAGFRIFAIFGDMGAGKTTFIKSICHHLGAADSVTSPTFTIVNEYMVPGEESLYHFDFYRINKITELYDFGFEEYIDSGRYCFIEWPEISEELLPPDTVVVRIRSEEDKSRVIEYTIPPVSGR
jgi:tRNA threonylcarbamoyladenosine biosynthesis protein TsaE